MNPFKFYGNMFRRRSAEDLRSLAHIKRFMECLSGDPEFRAALADNAQDPVELARERGIHVDPNEVAPLWREGFRANIPLEEINAAPKAALWTQWVADLIKFRDLLQERGDDPDTNPRFAAWRRRQIARTDDELGAVSKAIIHPVLSFELSRGCSVSCWFCGLAAEKLDGVFSYTPENRQLWREVLQASVDVFGSATQTAFCYHATEPSDNPHYLSYVQDFLDIVGSVPQTTSATPVKDLAWTRQLIDLYREHAAIPLRFSILSLKNLRRLHEAFAPEELLGVELLMQQKDSMLVKGRAGRTRHARHHAGENDRQPRVAEESGTVACISGFLVNMVDRVIRLISPCPASDRWPLGYRIHRQGSFGNVNEFRGFLEETIREHMPEHVPVDWLVRFRRDLACSHVPDGFVLKSKKHAHRVTGGPFVPVMGKLISEGNSTTGEIMEAVLADGGDFLGAGATLKDLFDKGLLDDDPLDWTARA